MRMNEYVDNNNEDNINSQVPVDVRAIILVWRERLLASAYRWLRQPMSGKSLTADEARHELYTIMKTPDPFEQKAERALMLGERYLGVTNGHLTRIDTESDYWKAVASTDSADGRFPPGLTLDLGTTYCRRTVQEGPIALNDAPNQGWADDPAYEKHGLDTYHGTALIVDDEPMARSVSSPSRAARSRLPARKRCLPS